MDGVRRTHSFNEWISRYIILTNKLKRRREMRQVDHLESAKGERCDPSLPSAATSLSPRQRQTHTHLSLAHETSSVKWRWAAYIALGLFSTGDAITSHTDSGERDSIGRATRPRSTYTANESHKVKWRRLESFNIHRQNNIHWQNNILFCPLFRHFFQDTSKIFIGYK